jgi:hypothetical protein
MNMRRKGEGWWQLCQPTNSEWSNLHGVAFLGVVALPFWSKIDNSTYNLGEKGVLKQGSALSSLTTHHFRGGKSMSLFM